MENQYTKRAVTDLFLVTEKEHSSKVGTENLGRILLEKAYASVGIERKFLSQDLLLFSS